MPGGSPPDLLNEDGTASVATALMMSHHGLRRDLARFATALERSSLGTTEVSALREEWNNYRNTLHGHHQAEDTGVFPSALGEDPGLAPVTEQLTREHRLIDPLLERGDRAFALLPDATEALAVVNEIATLLRDHLALEEARVIPVLRRWQTFPPPADDAEAALYADGFAWSSHGIAPEVLDRVNEMLQPSLTSRLPAARVAFAERWRRVWGDADPGAAHTPIPEAWNARFGG
jgi:hypothetical protein